MIAIIDYDAGNLKSVEKAFLALGEECVVTRDHDSIRRADRVVLPGVGSFGTAMQQLKKYELDQVIREVVQEDKPFLSIVWVCNCCLRAARRVTAWRDFICWTERS